MCAARVFTEVFYRSRGNLVAVGTDMSERLTRDEGFLHRVKFGWSRPERGPSVSTFSTSSKTDTLFHSPARRTQKNRQKFDDGSRSLLAVHRLAPGSHPPVATSPQEKQPLIFVREAHRASASSLCKLPFFYSITSSLSFIPYTGGSCRPRLSYP